MNVFEDFEIVREQICTGIIQFESHVDTNLRNFSIVVGLTLRELVAV